MDKYGVPTSTLLRQLLSTKNAVTRGVLADIIGDRIDRQRKGKDE